jgi:uncharacterized protein YciI
VALFVLICIDKPQSLSLRMATREAHLAYVRDRPGVVRLGGPFLDDAGEMAGSLMILEAADLAAAEAFHRDDPYRVAGLFERAEIKPFRTTIGGL